MKTNQTTHFPEIDQVDPNIKTFFIMHHEELGDLLKSFSYKQINFQEDDHIAFEIKLKTNQDLEVDIKDFKHCSKKRNLSVVNALHSTFNDYRNVKVIKQYAEECAKKELL